MASSGTNILKTVQLVMLLQKNIIPIFQTTDISMFLIHVLAFVMVEKRSPILLTSLNMTGRRPKRQLK
nr:MAG TPA_asm: hypothetical protein [Caudoviricetes sp.]